MSSKTVIETAVLHKRPNDYFVGGNKDVLTFTNGPYYLVLTGPDWYRLGKPESVTVEVKPPAPLEPDITVGLTIGNARRLKAELDVAISEYEKR